MRNTAPILAADQLAIRGADDLEEDWRFVQGWPL